jgi:DNA polymerase III subunit delta
MSKESNVIFLYGNDEFAIARRLLEFQTIFSDPTTAEMNTARLEARSMREDEFNNAVNAVPFLAKQRLVLLANPSERYSTAPGRKNFFNFIEKVPLQTQLVIYENVEVKTYRNKSKEATEDEKHWLVKWIRKTGLGLERFAMPAIREMTGWIISYAREKGGVIDQAAAAKLAEMVGADTRQAAQEVAKLLAYVNWARPVKVQDVEAVSPFTAEPDIFAMVDALASGAGPLAQKVLHRLMESGDPFSVWGMVVRQFRLLLLAREVIEAHGGPAEVEEALHLHAFVAEKIFGQAKHYSLPALEKIYHRLLEIDIAAKTSQVTLDLALEILVVELTV